jgi:xanthine dehydrogenase accessory factor
LDFSIVIVDDREEFARPELFDLPNVEQVLRLPPDYVGLPEPDEATYVALVTKGFLTDEAALRRVIDSPAPYIGMIGSKRKREEVFNNLRKDGISEEKLSAIHAPIGLNIGSDSPEEIAISILAEIIQVRSERRKATPAKDE